MRFAQVDVEGIWHMIDRIGFSGAGFVVTLYLLFTYGREWLKIQIALGNRALETWERLRKENEEKDAAIKVKDDALTVAQSGLKKAEQELIAARGEIQELRAEVKHANSHN